MRTSILTVGLESRDLGSEASLIAQRALAAITAAPLSRPEEESFSDEFFAFRERKNGSAWVLKDAEDSAVRACLGAFECCCEPDEAPFETADDVEMLLAGKVGPLRVVETEVVGHVAADNRLTRSATEVLGHAKPVAASVCPTPSVRGAWSPSARLQKPKNFGALWSTYCVM